MGNAAAGSEAECRHSEVRGTGQGILNFHLHGLRHLFPTMETKIQVRELSHQLSLAYLKSILVKY